MNMFLQLDNFGVFKDLTSEEQKVCRNYLDIGEKIFSLVQNKEEFKPIPILDISFNGYAKAKHPMNYLRKRIAEKHIQPLTQNKLDMFLTELKDYVDITLSPTDEKSCVNLQRQYMSDAVPYIANIDTLTNICVVEQLPLKYHWGTIRNNGKSVVSLEYLIADFLIYKEIRNYMKKNGLYNIIIERLLHKSEYLFKYNWHMADKLGEYSEVLQAEFSLHGKGLQFGETVSLPDTHRMYPFKFIPLLIGLLQDLPRFSLFRDTESFHVLADLFMQVVEEYQTDKQTDSYIKRLSTGCATAWQTKKNIPEHVIAAMEESKFNESFGYVEFDKDVDLVKIKQLEQEFDALKHFFRQKCLKEHSLRFRYLGKHKALGLYFPTIHCLCVDLNSPSSFSHEFFHLLDYKFDKLSRKYNFEQIRKRYELALTKNLKELKSYESMKSSNTKYNLSYFLEPTEIFARCGEMYLVKKGVNNSLASPDKTAGFSYPEDEELLGMIEEYFDTLLPSLYEY